MGETFSRFLDASTLDVLFVVQSQVDWVTLVFDVGVRKKGEYVGLVHYSDVARVFDIPVCSYFSSPSCTPSSDGWLVVKMEVFR